MSAIRPYGWRSISLRSPAKISWCAARLFRGTCRTFSASRLVMRRISARQLRTGRSRAVASEAAAFYHRANLARIPTLITIAYWGHRARTRAELRRNMAFLIRWLHPDHQTLQSDSSFAARAYAGVERVSRRRIGARPTIYLGAARLSPTEKRKRNGSGRLRSEPSRRASQRTQGTFRSACWSACSARECFEPEHRISLKGWLRSRRQPRGRLRGTVRRLAYRLHPPAVFFAYRKIVVVALAVLLTWDVITRSLVAYLLSVARCRLLAARDPRVFLI